MALLKDMRMGGSQKFPRRLSYDMETPTIKAQDQAAILIFLEMI